MRTHDYIALWGALVISNVWTATGHWLAGALWALFAGAMYFVAKLTPSEST